MSESRLFNEITKAVRTATKFKKELTKAVEKGLDTENVEIIQDTSKLLPVQIESWEAKEEVEDLKIRTVYLETLLSGNLQEAGELRVKELEDELAQYQEIFKQVNKDNRDAILFTQEKIQYANKISLEASNMIAGASEELKQYRFIKKWGPQILGFSIVTIAAIGNQLGYKIEHSENHTHESLPEVTQKK